jgi:DNA-binding transcriptional regulator GbsR (MarR family)
MARIILDQRKRREIDPTVSVLRDCLRELEGKGASDTEMRERLEVMMGFVEMLTSLYAQMSRLPTGTIRGLLSAQGKVRRLLTSRRALTHGE